MSSATKILILGASSFVGRYLFASLGPEQAVATFKSRPVDNGVYFDSLTMGLSEVVGDPEKISHGVILLGNTKPDSCASDVRKSQALNVGSIKSILEWLGNWGIKPVFTSSEVVFDGVKGGYTEADQVGPILRYATQKVEIEEYLQESFKEFIIARLSEVYGLQRGDGTIFTNWLDDIEKGRPSHCAQDYVSCPVFVGDAVEALNRLMAVGARGIFHVCSHQPFSRLRLYEILLAQLEGRVPAGAQANAYSIHDFNTVNGGL